MTFEETKSKIKNSLKTGDIPNIIGRAGLKTTTAFYAAFKRKNWADLTVDQERVITAAIEYINEREKGRNRAEKIISSL